MFSSLYDQTTLIALMRDRLAPIIGKKAVRQIVRAIEKPTDWFNRTIIEPRLFKPDFGGGTYYPVALDARSRGRNHRIAEAIATDDPDLKEFKQDLLRGVTLFANALYVAEPEIHHGVEVFRPPSERVVLDEHHVFTFEFDVANPAFLVEQFAWLRSSKNMLDCPMGAFFRHLSGFADFRGLTVCWSGHKSLHIHIVFATDLARARLGLDRVAAADLRIGLIAHWERLEGELLRLLRVQNHRPDPHLKYPESFRRLPNGGRRVEAGHMLGLPAGIHIPQITLWERARERAAGDDLPLFFTPEPFQASAVGAAASPARRTRFTTAKKLGDIMSAAEVAYCEERLREAFPGGPRFDSLAFEGGRWVGKFKNSENDRTPSSLMREDYQTVHLVGRDAEGLTPRPLPYPLGFMLRVWCGHWADQNGRPDAAVSFAEVMHSGETHPLRAFERWFRERVYDAASAAKAMRHLVLKSARNHDYLLISGPEGVGKTSVVMEEHRRIVGDLTRRGDSGLAMYTFADYGTARSKCADFNSLNAGRGYRGVVLPSFSRAYEQACASLSVSPISNEDAARAGFSSRMAAIRKLQPGVLDIFKAHHNAIWAEIGADTPVFFTVHAVAHEWLKYGLTRLMWAPSHWDAFVLDENRHRLKLRRETTLGLLVHDEVKVESMVEMAPEIVVRWIGDLVASAPNVWKQDAVMLPDALASYDAFVAQRGLPVIDGRAVAIPFERARRLAALTRQKFDHVVTIDSGVREPDAG